MDRDPVANVPSEQVRGPAAIPPAGRHDCEHYEVSVDLDPAAVESQWRELEAGGAATPFQTRAWLLPWYRIVAPAFGVSPLFATLRERASGRPLMLLPLCLRRRHGVLRVEFPDLGTSDYNAPLLAPGFAPEMSMGDDGFAALWQDILAALPRADLICFEKMPETLAGRPNPLARLAGATPMRGSAWGIELPESRAAYEETLKTVIRGELRRKRRNLEREGPMRYRPARLEAEGRQVFEALKRQRRIRWPNDILGDPAFLRFYEAAIFDAWPEGLGRLSALWIGDEIAATLFALAHDGRYLLLLHSFEPERWGTNSPGIVAIDSAISDQIDCGTAYFDFTIGDEPYKQQFGVQGTRLYSYHHPVSPLGRLALAMSRAKKFAAKRVRR